MSTLKISGASDDLIEVEGAIVEEFSPTGDDGEIDYLAASDGTLLSVEYAKDGCWRLHVIKTGVGTDILKTEGDPDADYTDRVQMVNEKPYTWVLLGHDFARAAK